ncbi:MAG TPA: hypothetical protein DCL44_01585 [Elusimicrobia bacterium]|nr:hypothetical protein [Elusimicrobiota bacterium]
MALSHFCVAAVTLACRGPLALSATELALRKRAKQALPLQERSAAVELYMYLKSFRRRAGHFKDRRTFGRHCHKLAVLGLIVLLPTAGRGGVVNTAITSKAIYSSAESSFLPGQEGLRLKRGLNLLVFESARVNVSSKTAVYLELKQSLADNFTRAEIFKLYFSARLAGLSVLLGKDSFNIGPAENGLLLSKNAAPFPMLRIANEKPLRILGDWYFLVLNGWFYDSDSGARTPQLIAVRARYSPWSALALGVTRTSYYGGPGRPGYTLWEYPKLLLGANENVVGSRYDTDGYLGYDITLALPEKLFPAAIKSAKLYYEDAGTDVQACWQKEDSCKKYYFPFGIRLQLRSYTGGLVAETDRDRFRFEFQCVNGQFYTHHWYPVEAYQGLSFGSPYGRNLQQFFFSHERKTGERSGFKYEFGYIRQPAFARWDSLNPGAERYYASFALSKGRGKVTVEPFARLDMTKNRNSDIAPVAPGGFRTIKGNRLFVTLGLSATLGF